MIKLEQPALLANSKQMWVEIEIATINIHWENIFPQSIPFPSPTLFTHPFRHSCFSNPLEL